MATSGSWFKVQRRLEEWRRWPALPGLLAVTSAAVVHYGVLGEFFADDDFLHLYRAVNGEFLEFVMTPHCGHILVARNALFYLLHFIFGLQSVWYFLLVLLTHLVNVFLVFRVSRSLTSWPWLSAFIAAMWGSSAVLTGTLTWYSVHGHSVLATLLLWILDDISRLDAAEASIPVPTLIRWYVLLLVATTMFGVGIGVAMAAGPVLYCLLPQVRSRGRIALAFSSLLVVVPALYVGLRGLFTAVYGGLDEPPMVLPLDPEGIRLIVLTTIDLLAYGLSSLVLGGLATTDLQSFVLQSHRGESLKQAFQIFHGVLGLGIFATIWAARRADSAWRWRVLGLSLLAGAVYGQIAVGRTPYIGWLLEGPESLAAVARYHYVAPMLLALGVGLVLAKLCELSRWPTGWLRAIAVGWMSVLLATSTQAIPPLRTTLPNARRTEFFEAVSEMRRQIRQAPPGEAVILQNHEFSGVFWGKKTRVLGCQLPLYPGHAAVFVTAFPDNTVEDHPVFFLEPDRQVRAEVRKMRGTRINSLIIGPQQAAALRRAARLRRGHESK